MNRLVYVCAACGKTAERREKFADVSCAINSVLCRPAPEGSEYPWEVASEEEARAHAVCGTVADVRRLMS